MKIFHPSLWTTADLLTHLWQSTVVALVVLVLLAFCDRFSAKMRHGLAWIALLKFAFPVALLTSMAQVETGAGAGWPKANPLLRPAEWSITVFSVPSAGALLLRADVGGMIATGLWLAGAGGFFGLWLVRAGRVRRRIVADAVPVSAEMQRRVEVAAARAGLPTPPRCGVGPDDMGPGVIGIFAPMVILPERWSDTLTSVELEAVLLHEIVHVQRRDNLWSAVQALFGSLFWFHPLVALLNRRISIEREKVCDQCVLDFTGDPDAYANGIVKSLKSALGLVQPGCAGIATPPVAARLTAILAYPGRRERPVVRCLVLAAGVMLLTLSGYAGSFVTVGPTEVKGHPGARLPAALAVKALPAQSSTEKTPVSAAAPALPAEEKLPLPSESPASFAMRSPVALASAEIGPVPLSVREPTPRFTGLETEARVERLATNAVDREFARGGSDGITGGRTFPPEKINRSPVVISQPPPVYPLAMQRTKQSGTVLVDLVVGAQGNVISARADPSSDRRFERAALLGVRKWKFQPGMKDGRAAEMPAQVSVIFAFPDE